MLTTEALLRNTQIFDREYTGLALTLAASAARTAGANGTTFDLLKFDRAIFVLDITASAHEAGDTLDVFIDISPDGGTKWINAIHFAQQAGDGAAKTEMAILCADNPGALSILTTADCASGVVRPSVMGNKVRARWAIADSGDADSSHTFSVKALLQ